MAGQIGEDLISHISIYRAHTFGSTPTVWRLREKKKGPKKVMKGNELKGTLGQL